MGAILGFSIWDLSHSGSGHVRNSGKMDVNSFLSHRCVPVFKIFTSESQMCAIRLNWMADLPFDQAGAGQNERNPCFTEGVNFRVNKLAGIV